MVSNQKYFVFIFTLGFSLPILFFIWDENVDPPFIPNARYEALVYKFIPVLVALLCIALLVLGYKKYQDSSFRRETKTYFADAGRLNSILGIIFLPVLLYGFIFAYIAAPIKLWAFYSAHNYWSQEYRLGSVKGCGVEYERECVRLTFLDLESNKKYTVRWYLDKSKLIGLEDKVVHIIGGQNYFGYIINEMEW